jgi:ADP-heptose:LPS heptosyltransferase
MQPQTRAVLRHTGARLLAGYDHDGRFPWLDIALEWEGDRKLQRKRAPIAERLVQLVEATAAAFETRRPWRPKPEVSPEATLALLPPAFAGRRLVCVHPDVGDPLRRWPAAHFAALIDLLVSRAHCAVVLIGSEDEAAVADAVLRGVRPNSPVLWLAGKLPLAYLPTLLQSCALFVGNNSGPQHLAASLGVPTVGVHAGITDAREWGPVGEIAVAIQRRMRCGPCYIEFADECPREFACLTGLRPRDVFIACLRLLAAGAPHERLAEEHDGCDAGMGTAEETYARDEHLALRGNSSPTAGQGDEHIAAAEEMSLLPPRPDAESPEGYIETVAAGDGVVWIMGWMQPGHALEFPAVIAELRPGGARHAAVVSVAAYTRTDLPPGAHGIIGIAACSWQPTLREGVPDNVSLFFGNGGHLHLRCHQPLRLLTAAEFAGEYQGLQNRRLIGQQSPAMQRTFGALESWTPTQPGAAWIGVEISVDRILLVPGLGCFIEGWVLSPLRRVEGFRLRIGRVVMAMEPHTLTWKPRSDLVAVYPGSEAMAERAGFVGLLEGSEEPAEFTEPILKILFEGGAYVNWLIPLKVFQRLGQSARLEDTKRFFPALEEEAFFASFARAVFRAERASVFPAVPVQIAAAERVIIIGLSQERCDLFMAFAQAARHARHAGSGWGVAFLTSAGASRSDALWLFREFALDCPEVAASLLTIAEPSHSFALLPDVLAAVGAKRFLFVGDGVFLTKAGWAAVPEALDEAGDAPMLFGDAGDDLGARCFAWSAAHFARWSAGSPAYLGGIYGDNGLAAETPVIMQGMAWCSRPVVRSSLQAAVNRALES